LTTQLKNVGLTVLNIQSITIGGTNPADFTAQSFCPASLSPGSSCNINVTFTPLVKGSLSATLVLTSNDGTRTVPLSGTGKQGGSAPAPLDISADAAIVQLSPGGKASIGINVQSTADEGTLMLTWSGPLPPGVTVSLNPASIDATLTNQPSSRVTMTVDASASASLAPRSKGRTPPLYAALFPVLGIVGLALGRKRRNVVYLALVFAGLMILSMMGGCGGRVTPSTPSSPLNVTVTSMSTGHSASTSVTLQLM
jgi:hypothetical protein